MLSIVSLYVVLGQQERSWARTMTQWAARMVRRTQQLNQQEEDLKSLRSDLDLI
jgi:hypothetical protein